MAIGSISTFVNPTVKLIDQATKGQPKPIPVCKEGVTGKYTHPCILPKNTIEKMTQHRIAFLNSLGKGRFRNGRWLSFCASSLRNHHDERVREAAAWAIARLWDVPFPKGFDKNKEIAIRITALYNLDLHQGMLRRNKIPNNYRVKRACKIVYHWIGRKIPRHAIQRWKKHPSPEIRGKLSNFLLSIGTIEVEEIVSFVFSNLKSNPILSVRRDSAYQLRDWAFAGATYEFPEFGNALARYAMRIVTGDIERGNSKDHRMLRTYALDLVNTPRESEALARLYYVARKTPYSYIKSKAMAALIWYTLPTSEWGTLSAEGLMYLTKLISHKHDRVLFTIAAKEYLSRYGKYDKIKLRHRIVKTLIRKFNDAKSSLYPDKTSSLELIIPFLKHKARKVRNVAISSVINMVGPKKAMRIFQKHLSEEDKLLVGTAMIVLGGLALVLSVFPNKNK